MKLIIDIPEEDYNFVKKQVADGITNPLKMRIANGIPLPEKHGRLVDMSEVLIKLMQFYDGNKSIGQCLDEVSTIIEADGGDVE